jgi:hypothetical protein
MAESLSIRDVQSKLKNWIESEREQAILSRGDYVIRALETAHNSKAAPSPFDASQHPEPAAINRAPCTLVDLFAAFAPTGRRDVATGGATRL